MKASGPAFATGRPSPSPATPMATSTRTPRSACPARARWSSSTPGRRLRRSASWCTRFRWRRRSPGITTWTPPSLVSPVLLRIRPGHQAGPVVLHQGHHLKRVRPPLQGDLPGDLRRRIRGQVRGGRHHLLLHPHRRRRGRVIAGRRRLHLGLQELRRRRDERHGLHAFGSLAMMTSVLVSPSGAYEFEAAHGTISATTSPGGQGDLHQPHATIFAWSGSAQARRLDSCPSCGSPTAWEAATLATIRPAR